ncbi:MAG: sugar phosphate isomerase/epimerase [bacterium]|nr:MAG: sugar phosphate isomerase/epimerase [bacterium]
MSPGQFFARASLSNLQEDLAFLDRNGFLPEVYLPATALDDLDNDRLDPLVRIRESGRPVSLHAPFMDLSPAGLDPRVLEVTRYRFTQVKQIGEIVDPCHVVFHPGYDSWRFGWQKELWLEKSIGIWSEMIEWGIRNGVRIVLENVFDPEPDHLLMLHERLSGAFGFCFDTGHFLLFSQISLEEWLFVLGDSLAELHLHDNRGDRDSHLPVGEGIFDFQSLFAHVSQEDLSPLIVLEHHTREDTIRSLGNMEELLKGSGHDLGPSR